MKTKLLRRAATLLLVCACMTILSCRERDAIVIRISDDITGTWKATYGEDESNVTLILYGNGTGQCSVRHGKYYYSVKANHLTYMYDREKSQLTMTFDDNSLHQAKVLSLTTLTLVLQGWPDEDRWFFDRQ